MFKRALLMRNSVARSAGDRISAAVFGRWALGPSASGPAGARLGARRQFSSDDTVAPAAGTTMPDADGKRAVSPEIEALATQITSLNMIQSMDLVNVLAQKLGVSPDALFASGPAAPAGGAPAAGAADAGAADAGDAGADAAVATEVTLSLVSVEDGAKFKVLKEVRKLKPDLPLIECKKLVEKLPATIKEGVPREEAEAVVKAIKEVGGVVELV